MRMEPLIINRGAAAAQRPPAGRVLEWRSMPRLVASHHGEARLRLLRVQRRSDRHDPRDLTVTCRFEGDFPGAFTEGRTDSLVPGEALKNLVYATAHTADADGDIESFGLALCARLLATFRRLTRARVEIVEQPWGRLEVGGKARGDAFAVAGPERRTTAVTSNGTQTAVVSGIEQLTLLRTSGFRGTARIEDPRGIRDGLQSLLIATLAARWTYTSADVTFGSYRHGVRNAVVETFALHAGRSTPHTLYTMADVALGSCPDIADITLSLAERPYRPADLFEAGLENPDRLYVALDDPLGTLEVTVERD
jgi:urate oxidase